MNYGGSARHAVRAGCRADGTRAVHLRRRRLDLRRHRGRRHLADKGALVAGIDVNQYGKALRSSNDACIFTAGELEEFAHHLEGATGFRLREPDPRRLLVRRHARLHHAAAVAARHLQGRTEPRLLPGPAVGKAHVPR